jgi:hypothetical protein
MALSGFLDLFLATSQAILTGENYLLNETQPRNSLLRLIMKAHDMTDMLQGGDVITDQVIFDSDTSYAAYNPLTQRTPAISNYLTEISVGWAFSDANVTFSKHEKGLNQASSLNRGARSYVFKNIIKAKWSALFVGINKGMERELFAQPNNATMETVVGNTTRVPYSFFCTIHEFGAVNTDTNPTATVPPGFTTIQTVNPTTQPLWRNPVEFYAGNRTTMDAAAGTSANWDGFESFSAMYDRLRYEELAIRPEYGEPYDPEGFIITSKNGKKLYEHAIRRGNDYLRNGSANPAYPGLNYDGVPVLWRESMDTANAYSDAAGTGFAGENDATTDVDGAATANPLIEGPRFVWFVPKYFRAILHSEHFLEEERPPASVYQPYVNTIYFDCWHQYFNRSRQRAGGMVVPKVDVVGFRNVVE